ncbi:MAG: undecaprenyldiphospho-muramoylpentapeptide beta-N-acetylglucosaminyltransferase [Eubacterium sp.]|jgi:UDP-N-acetylglucosamine--N-acetylmuramyl-(pentapeptide) pyrophosphoryl-undecaprenol N-acetylglucosamine transferase|nr:undecaprenyldiphospho-muramoylpentapeptide beta-N-acetylglucosaminyltransferase [Eubacterium sp.]
MESLKALIAAGGTAGHINPGLAIADKIKAVFPKSEIIFLGTPYGLESLLVPKAGYGFFPIKMSGLQRRISLKNIAHNFKALYYYTVAKGEAKKLIKSFMPDIVIGTGGYVSAPAIKAAAALGIKTAAHESNSLPGISTKMLSKVANKVFIADEGAIKYIPAKEKCVVTGNPVRQNLKLLPKSEALKSLGLPSGFTILSFGGSLGANKITECVAKLLKWEQEAGEINHIHAYGKNGKNIFFDLLKREGIPFESNRTLFKEYINNMYTCYAAADLIISRSGSMTQTELKALGKASIQVPWPGAAENHQYYNALSMAKAGACRLIEDKDLTPENLLSAVKGLYDDKNMLAEMEKNTARLYTYNSADIIMDEILNLVRS